MKACSVSGALLFVSSVSLAHHSEAAYDAESVAAFQGTVTEFAWRNPHAYILVDRLNEQVFRELITYIMEDPHTISQALALMMISRYLERIADHATNIAEDVVYLVEGDIIRHHDLLARRTEPSEKPRPGAN